MPKSFSLCTHSCFSSETGVFFGAVLGPILLITIFSIAMIITVLFVLIRQVLRNHRQKTYSISKANPPPAGQTCKQILLLVCIMVLLGFSVTSFLLTTVWSGTSIDVAFGFRLAFLFCNSFQGFFIFVLLVFFNSEARNSWLKVLCPCCTRRDGISKSSSSDTAAQKTLKPGQFSRFSAASLNKSMTDQVERLKPDHEMKVINEAAEKRENCPGLRVFCAAVSLLDDLEIPSLRVQQGHSTFNHEFRASELKKTSSTKMKKP